MAKEYEQDKHISQYQKFSRNILVYSFFFHNFQVFLTLLHYKTCKETHSFVGFYYFLLDVSLNISFDVPDKRIPAPASISSISWTINIILTSSNFGGA